MEEKKFGNKHNNRAKGIVKADLLARTSLDQSLWSEQVRKLSNFAAVRSGHFAAWQSVSDILTPQGKSNFSKPLMDIYALGVGQILVRNVNDQEKIVTHALLPGNSPLAALGCWVEGDPQILAFHSWKDECYDAQPFNPSTWIPRTNFHLKEMNVPR